MSESLPVASPEERARALLGNMRQGPYPGSHTWNEAVSAIAAAIRFAEEQEREACAAVADLHQINPVWLGDPALGLSDNARRIAAAIRARSSR